MTLTHVNPTSMHHNPAFAQGVLVEGAGPLLVVGGQNGVDENLTQDVDITAAYAASQEVWGRHATAITVLFVAALGRPECRVEIEALAQVPAR